MELELTEDQAAELELLLDGALGELSHEIADTDNPQFRQRLRDRRVALEAIAQKLGHAAVRDAGVVTAAQRAFVTRSGFGDGRDQTGPTPFRRALECRSKSPNV